MADYDNTNRGSLFDLRDHHEVIRQGKLNIDGNEHRVIAVKRNNKDGQPIVELYRSIGTIKKNDNKTSDKHPDSKGMVEKITVESVKQIAAWRKTSKNGNDYTSLSVSDLRPRDDVPQVNEQASGDLDDEIPF